MKERKSGVDQRQPSTPAAAKTELDLSCDGFGLCRCCVCIWSGRTCHYALSWLPGDEVSSLVLLILFSLSSCVLNHDSPLEQGHLQPEPLPWASDNSRLHLGDSYFHGDQERAILSGGTNLTGAYAHSPLRPIARYVPRLELEQ